MSQNLARRSLNRSISPRSTSINQYSPRSSSKEIYSPRSNMRPLFINPNVKNVNSSYPTKRYNSPYSVNSPYSTKSVNSSFPTNSNQKVTAKNASSTVNWISHLGDISFPSQKKRSTSCTKVSPSAFLLFPSPSTPITRTPKTLRKIIDDSGFQILRESPLSARDSYYAKDINEGLPKIRKSASGGTSARPYSMRYSCSDKANQKTFVINAAKSERNQRYDNQFNLNDHSNLNMNSKLNSDLLNSKNENDLKLQAQGRETQSQKKRRVDFENFFDMTEFNLDKFDLEKLNANDDISADTSIDDIKADLANQQPEMNSKSEIQNGITSPIKPPQPKMPIQSELLTDEKTVSQNSGSNPANSVQKVKDGENEVKSQVTSLIKVTIPSQPKTAKSVHAASDLQLSCRSGSSPPNIKSDELDESDFLKGTETDDYGGFDDADQIFRYPSEYRRTFDMDNFDESAVNGYDSQMNEPINIDIFGDVNSFLYPERSKSSSTSLRQKAEAENGAEAATTGRKSVPSIFSECLNTSPSKSSFKSDDDEVSSTSRNERRSVKFIFPENDDGC